MMIVSPLYVAMDRLGVLVDRPIEGLKRGQVVRTRRRASMALYRQTVVAMRETERAITMAAK